MTHYPCLFLFPFSFFLFPSFVRADGGMVRLSERVGGYRITVFTSPTPLRAGPVDISVLVQDAATGKPLPHAEIALRLRHGDTELAEVATQAAATNKLFQAAKFELPAAGRWNVEVAIDAAGMEPAQVRCELEAFEPLPRWQEMWLWIALPLLPIGLFCVHQVLSRLPGEIRGRAS